MFSSTPPLIADYQSLGFAVLPGEYDPDTKTHTQPTPNVIVRQIGEETAAARRHSPEQQHADRVPGLPRCPAQIRRLFHDPILTEQGDLTETRNYSTYTRDMAGAIDLKYDEIQPFLRPGKIVDEGCADGALLERVAQDFPDSDLIGVDLSAEMLARAHEAQRAGAFGGAFVFFKQQNLMTPVSDAQADRADTIICNSTLHELWSYGAGRRDGPRLPARQAPAAPARRLPGHP